MVNLPKFIINLVDLQLENCSQDGMYQKVRGNHCKKRSVQEIMSLICSCLYNMHAFCHGSIRAKGLIRAFALYL